MTGIDFSKAHPRRLLSIFTDLRHDGRFMQIEKKLRALKRSRKFDAAEIERLEQRIKKIKGL